MASKRTCSNHECKLKIWCESSLTGIVRCDQQMPLPAINCLQGTVGEVSVKGYLKHQQVSHDDMYPCNTLGATFFWEPLTNLDLILLKQSTLAAAIRTFSSQPLKKC